VATVKPLLWPSPRACDCAPCVLTFDPQPHTQMPRNALLRLRLSPAFKRAVAAAAAARDEKLSEYVRRVLLESLGTPSPLAAQHSDYALAEPTSPLPARVAPHTNSHTNSRPRRAARSVPS
jgi:hypothetical protein